MQEIQHVKQRIKEQLDGLVFVRLVKVFHLEKHRLQPHKETDALIERLLVSA